MFLTNESYTTKAACLGGVESVRKNAPSDANYNRKQAMDGELYFVLVAANHQPIGRSEM